MTAAKQSLTKDMRLDVLAHDIGSRSVDLLQAMPELRRIESFANYEGSARSKTGLHRDKLITYIIIAYSHDSPLNIGVRDDWEVRMRKAAEYALLMETKAETTKTEELVFTLESQEVVLMIVEYLEYQSRDDWAEWCILQHELRENTAIRLAPITASSDKEMIMAQEKKATFRKGSKEIRDQIKEYELKVFGDADLLRHVKSAKEYTSIEKLVKSRGK
jgi:DNA polymerase elongation subunit (family B)